MYSGYGGYHRPYGVYGTAGGGYGMYGNNEESAIVRRAEVREKIENSIIKRKA